MVQFDPSLETKLKEKLLEKFRRFDKDGNGYVSQEEFQNSIITEYQKTYGVTEITREMPNGQKLPSGEMIPHEVLTAQNNRFAQFDKTKDQNNEGLDFKEFSAMYRDEIYEELTGSKLQLPRISDEIDKTDLQKGSLDIHA